MYSLKALLTQLSHGQTVVPLYHHQFYYKRFKDRIKDYCCSASKLGIERVKASSRCLCKKSELAMIQDRTVTC